MIPGIPEAEAPEVFAKLEDRNDVAAELDKATVEEQQAREAILWLPASDFTESMSGCEFVFGHKWLPSFLRDPLRRPYKPTDLQIMHQVCPRPSQPPPARPRLALLNPTRSFAELPMQDLSFADFKAPVVQILLHSRRWRASPRAMLTSRWPTRSSRQLVRSRRPSLFEVCI